VVAVALEHPAQRPLARAQDRPGAVVLEARPDARAVQRLQLDLDRGGADKPRAVDRAPRDQVHQADAGDALVAELVVVAEQLDAAADPEDDRAATGRRAQRVALDVVEVLRAQLLVAVLA